jgi:formamidase
VYASSRHIPGVRFAGLIHPGLIGTAPSQELLDTWNARERALVDGDAPTLAGVLHTRPLACLPEARGACLGSVPQGSAEWARIASEGARTVPGRENGGNCDIKNLSRGCRVYLPVFVEGAHLSMGDMHFSQGDGEVSFCGAIEMSGFLTLKCDIIRGGMETYLTPMGPSKLHVHPFFEIGPLEPRYSEWLVFQGISVDESGKQHYLDASVAYKRAVLDCINYLAKFGFTREQAYLLLSCCPCEGRLSGIVDVPNAVATLALPLAIFDVDIRPQKTPPGVPPTGPSLLRVPRGNVCLCTYDGDKPTFQNVQKKA